MSDFTPLDRQDIVHLAFSFQRRVNLGECEAAREFARSGRLRTISRRRELTSREVSYSAPRPVLSLAEFEAAVNEPKAANHPAVIEGHVVTPMFLHDFSPMQFENHPLDDTDVATMLKDSLETMGFDVDGSGWETTAAAPKP